MKAALQFVASLLALGGLLGAAASNATNVADKPLKASVFAKPRVIFGLDDSSSMDFEVMLNTNDGAFWWDFNARSGWDSSGTPWFNAVGDANSQWKKMAYLFPNGTATGARVNADSTDDHFAIPPTAQFAFLRSHAYNPLYYNPAVTYSPWSPAYISGALVSFPNATPTAAKSHPVFGTTVTMDLTNSVTSTAANNTFTALPGMILPGTATVCAGSCGTWPAVSAQGWAQTAAGSGLYTVPSGTKTNVSMAYYPATYYLKETCIPDDSTCVKGPDFATNGATLKRYEIRPANYAVPGDYTAAKQNFANWWQYYRKRKMMLSGSMGNVMEQLSGLSVGVVIFNNQSNVTMYDVDSTDPSQNNSKLSGIIYSTNGSGGTPTRETLKYIGEQYRNTAGVIQYACQRNNAFILTDGFANATVSAATTPPAYSQALWGSGVPYQTTYASTLADIALGYYTLNLKPSFSTAKVPQTPNDQNTNLHMNTYGMTLGAKGTIFVDSSTPAPTNASAWPNPTAQRSPTSVDDLWHATINGRGKMYVATTSTETALSIQAGMNDILSAAGAQSGVAVSTINLSRGDGFAYMGTYNPAGWTGDLTANAINASTGVIATTPTWSAAALLNARDWTTRQIASSTGSGGAAFTAGAVGGTVNPSNTWGVTADLMNYLRGDASNEGTAFRSRNGRMGAVINAEPAISRDDDMAFVASSEGMLHAFDIRAGATRGKELWAYVPRAVLPNIGQTSARGYAFFSQLDGSPVIGKTGTSSKILVAGMGPAGRYYYALDASAPRTYTESDLSWVKWEFPAVGDSATQSKVGLTMGKPLVVNTSAGYRVLVTSGYNNTLDGKGRLFVLNPADGSIAKEFATTAGSLSAESGLAHVTGFVEDTGLVQYVYGGDLLGNLWRFDLNAASGTAPVKVAVLKSGSGLAQSVTAPPTLTRIQGRRVVLIGTGRLLDPSDWGNTNSQSQSFYAIADGATIDPARGSLVAETYTHSGDALTTSPVNWATQRGWYMDLPTGEQANTQPSLAYGAVTFTTNAAGATDCSAASWLYVMDVLSGGASPGLGFVSMQVSATANVSSARTVLTVQSPTPPGPGPGPQDCPGGLVALMQTTDGHTYQKCVSPPQQINPSKNSWREVRRE